MDKIIFKFYLCALIAMLVIPSVIYAASFDCSKASSKTEKAICSDSALSKLDDDLSIAYSKALNGPDSSVVKMNQRKWLKETLASCQNNKDCIIKAYESRIKQLYAIGVIDKITGSYVYDIDRKDDYAGCWLQIEKLSNEEIKFQLDCCTGAPSYNTGYVSGIITFTGNMAVYENNELGSCKFIFKFLKDKVTVSQPGTDCDRWGHAVYAGGVYKLKSREVPKFEQPE